MLVFQKILRTWIIPWKYSAFNILTFKTNVTLIQLTSAQLLQYLENFKASNKKAKALIEINIKVKDSNIVAIILVCDFWTILTYCSSIFTFD